MFEIVHRPPPAPAATLQMPICFVLSVQFEVFWTLTTVYLYMVT
ncbi:hypothetical protein ART_0632 [Arthrobacter sp. PAMC 25486]|nr:hypothetical protein ART_0632 [Arthrobacter sp. PAMC 25486]